MGNTADNNLDRLLSKKDVAKRLALSVRSVDRLIARGLLQRVKVLGAVRFRLSEVVAIMNSEAA